MRWVLVVLCVVVVLWPVGSPTDVSPELSELATEIQSQLSDAPDDTAAMYAGWFFAMRDTLTESDEKTARIRQAWIESKRTLGVPSLLGEIAARELKPYDGEKPDRAAYAAAVERLGNACAELCE